MSSPAQDLLSSSLDGGPRPPWPPVDSSLRLTTGILRQEVFSTAIGKEFSQLPCEPSELGPEADQVASKFVADPNKNLFFLVPGDHPQVVVATEHGNITQRSSVNDMFPLLTADDTVEPHEIFLAPDGHAIVLVRIFLGAEQRSDAYLIHLNAEARAVKTVKVDTPKGIAVADASAAFLDDAGTLWFTQSDEATHLVSAEGKYLQALPFVVSYVSRNGLAFRSQQSKITAYAQSGVPVYSLRADELAPGAIDGELAPGYLFAWQPSDESKEGATYYQSRAIAVYRATPVAAELQLHRLGISHLPPLSYQVPHPNENKVVVGTFYINRFFSRATGLQVYELGRQPQRIFIETMQILVPQPSP